jgi:hypothetical protein
MTEPETDTGEVQTPNETHVAVARHLASAAVDRGMTDHPYGGVVGAAIAVEAAGAVERAVGRVA